ncbi:hypothetical protein D3C80_2028440 [compost metagenome]
MSDAALASLPITFTHSPPLNRVEARVLILSLKEMLRLVRSLNANATPAPKYTEPPSFTSPGLTVSGLLSISLKPRGNE